MLAAFEDVTLKDRSEHESKAWNKKQKEGRVQKKKEVLLRKEALTDSNTIQAKIRCYNCSKYGHLSKDCKLPKGKRVLVLNVERRGIEFMNARLR